jgi:hypothetical protein
MYKKHNLKVDYIASSIKDLITKIWKEEEEWKREFLNYC